VIPSSYYISLGKVINNPEEAGEVRRRLYVPAASPLAPGKIKTILLQ